MEDLSRFADNFEPGSFGRPLHFFSETDSTNTQAMALARQGAPEGTLVLAEAQSAGRGRLGRRWHSLPGASLAFSLVLRPPLTPTQASQVTLLCAVGMARAIRACCDVPAEIKWPNDVLIHGRKVCGILVEMQGSPESVDFLVAGLGVNVGQQAADFPPEVRGIATSLALESAAPASRSLLLKAFLQKTQSLYRQFLADGFQAVAPEWKSLSCMTGRQVRAESQGRVVEGMALGLDSDGALLVRLDSGLVERLVSGEILLRHA